MLTKFKIGDIIFYETLILRVNYIGEHCYGVADIMNNNTYSFHISTINKYCMAYKEPNDILKGML